MTTGNTRFTCRLRQQNNLVRADYHTNETALVFYYFFLQMGDVYAEAKMQCLKQLFANVLSTKAYIQAARNVDRWMLV